jgi:hypothetical protein
MAPNKEQIWYKEARSAEFFFYRQPWHLLILLIMIPLSWSFAAPAMSGGSWLGMYDVSWFRLALIIPVIHQFITWIVFRLQLGWAALSKIFGPADLFVWGMVFLPLLIARPVSILGLAYSTRHSLALHGSISLSLGLVLLFPAIYTLWSVFKYFGLARAMGGDHFRIYYRQMPLVNKGAFKYSSNAMYSFAFLLLWSMALITGSQAALGAAFFQHVFIWAHHYCTEKPDMEIIYKD